MQQPQIVQFPETTIAGVHLPMSLAANRTFELWRSFMPRRREFQHVKRPELFSLQVYPKGTTFYSPDFQQVFEKWAAVAVDPAEAIPEGMSTLTIPEGMYAVFPHKGDGGPEDSARIFGYIFGEWLPASSYETDDRPHFELLGEKYRNGDPSSEEEIWIPLKPKSQANQ